MGEKRIDELNDAQYPSYYHYLPIDRDVAAETAKLKADYFGRANDSSDIRCLGNTNTTGAIIPSGKYFYKYDSYHSNRALAKAISNIAVNATLTENTNFKYVTIGEELDSLNAALSNKQDKSWTLIKSGTTVATGNSVSLGDIRDYNELCIVSQVSNKTYCGIMTIPTIVLTSGITQTRLYGFGEYATDHAYSGFRLALEYNATTGILNVKNSYGAKAESIDTVNSLVIWAYAR